MNKKLSTFVAAVWDFYASQGRNELPWRLTSDPYSILVSEVMLQQTQVDRVRPKYLAFVERFPTAQALANASLGDVLVMWQGLGYNSRAKRLWECAKTIIADHNGQWPRSREGLEALPGIGPYTAGALLAFAFNTATPIIETNIRSVFIHHFFNDVRDVADADIRVLIEQTLDTSNPREWYWALMDYGTYIKKTFGNPNKRAKTYSRQSKFAGSDRQIRGAIIRQLGKQSGSKQELSTQLAQFSYERVEEQLEKLVAEGMVAETQQIYALPS